MRLSPLLAVAVLAGPAPAQVLFEDNFTGGTLDATKWNVADWTFTGNRAWFGNTPTVAGGAASLKLDTYNAAHAGYFRGTEIYSKQAFALGADGLAFETRVRTNMTTAGAVTSFFTYATTTPNNYAQEIDFEVLTKSIASNKVLATTWKDWGAPGSNFNNGTNHRNNDVSGNTGQVAAGANLTDWTTLRIQWLPTRTEWYVNDTLFYSTTDAHPTAAMPIRLNFWAPDATWAAAYDGGLAPVGSAALNTTYTYDVDYVRVFVPVPEPAGLLAVAAVVTLGCGTRRRFRR